MKRLTSWKDKIFGVDSAGFDALALEVFRFQYESVELYRNFCDSLKRTPEQVRKLSDIPFLPIEFFKNHKIIAAKKRTALIFESSGTTGTSVSRHYVAAPDFYERSFLSAFRLFYGEPNDYVILALLPSYLERGNSSLIFMTAELIRQSRKTKSGFFLNEFEKLSTLLNELNQKKQKTILLGVTYALLDFAEQYPVQFRELIVMETGGMKGRREELVRAEVHQKLQEAFGAPQIHSEYGMTELLSQAYSKGRGIFHAPPWMRILPRDIYDPLKLAENGTLGAANIIDLANLYSCSFIAAADLTKVYPDGSFEIPGRLDSAEVRGCNLMVAETGMMQI